MADGSMKSHSPTPTESMIVYREAIALLELAYSESEGEVTEDTQALEQLAGMQREAALEAYARFLRGCEHAQQSVDAERVRLEAAEQRIAKRRAWAEQQLVALLEQEGQTSATAGSFRIKTRAGSRYVHTDPDFSLSSVPPNLLKWSEPRPAEPSLDKRAAKAYLDDPDADPVPGLSLQRKPRTVKVE